MCPQAPNRLGQLQSALRHFVMPTLVGALLPRAHL